MNGKTHFDLESINLNVQHVNGMTHFDLKSINLNAEHVNGMTDLVLRLLGTLIYLLLPPLASPIKISPGESTA